MEPVDNLHISSVVDLINEYAEATRTVAGEAGMAYPPLDFLDTLDALPAESVALADDLHRVFAEAHHATELLNQLADQYGLNHRLTSDGRLTWRRPATSSRLTTAATATLISFLDQHGSDRLGTCDAHACVDVYIDTSQARARSYCSTKCHSRARVARWRARQQQATPTHPPKEK
ncbi:MAG: CGNR zinc finger domain-containing protein [Actinomycetota bacterium]|nr:CGNR zinc finger domain-containing protein [Actinomycetota bacterium]